MTRDELSVALGAVFGQRQGAVADAARALEMNYDNLRQMLSGRRPVPTHVADRLEEMRRLRSVEPPPADTAMSDARDDECAVALEPHLATLLRRAVGVGWHPAEVLAAMVAWAVQGTLDGAGPEATLGMLEEARQGVMEQARAPAEVTDARAD
ncbi:hypothetical protein [Roseomonas mucosa]|uniref:hypothetical protein n=1 Tax=Roseomonas mucosa TaxID=207340 RepID=UPI0022465783|nr:hypothetical protein [Roseomonas mucosa]UZO91810.1 Hypothetical protein RMP42_05967 [Roseomonas mucosa]